jgi:SAM-dependent methyltransferase
VAEADAFFRPEDTRATYDTVARRYADEIASELDSKPFDREFLDRFAERLAGKGHVVELGAGPGHVAAYLATRGVDVSALDLSSAMVDEAKRLFPGLQAVVGDMLDLPYVNGSLAGVVASYSIIHFSDEQLEQAFKEMARVLRTGGYVALAFHVGDETVHREQWWDMPVVLDSRFLPVDLVTRLLAKAGLEVISSEEREPYAPEVEYQSRRAYIVAREPEQV